MNKEMNVFFIFIFVGVLVFSIISASFVSAGFFSNLKAKLSDSGISGFSILGQRCYNLDGTSANIAWLGGRCKNKECINKDGTRTIAPSSSVCPEKAVKFEGDIPSAPSYTAPSDSMKIVDGLPAGTTVDIDSVLSSPAPETSTSANSSDKSGLASSSGTSSWTSSSGYSYKDVQKSISKKYKWLDIGEATIDISNLKKIIEGEGVVAMFNIVEKNSTSSSGPTPRELKYFLQNRNNIMNVILAGEVDSVSKYTEKQDGLYLVDSVRMINFVYKDKSSQLVCN